MNSFLSSLTRGLEFVMPYVKKLWGGALALAGAAGDSIKKTNKKAKMHVRLMKIKNALEIISNITLIIATLIALLCALGEFLRRKDN